MPTGKAYIGLTTISVSERWRLHIIHANAAQNPVGIKAAILKHGSDAFKVEQVDVAYSIAELVRKEIDAIQIHLTRAPLGYNLTDGGELSTGTPIVVSGIEYPSITKAAESFDLPYKLVWSRLVKAKWSILEAFGLAPPPRLHKNSITIHGETFESQSELAKAYNISDKALWARLNLGWSIEEAVGIEPSPMSYELNGKFYISRAEAARQHGLEPHVVHHRLKRGWTVKQAFGLGPAPKSIVIGGMSFDNFALACSHFDVNYETATSRLSRGWTYDQALNISRPPRETSVTLGEVTYPSISAASKAYDLPEKVVRWRISNGWSMEQAFELQVPPKTISFGTIITIEGIEYPSISEATRSYGLNYETIKQRLQRGWTPEQAFELEFPPECKLSNANPTEVDGIVYPSFSEAARLCGLSPSTVRKRLKDGWTKNEAFGLEAKNNYLGPIAFEFEGRSFSSLRQAAEYYGIDNSVAQQRKNNGWTVEQILKTPSKSSKIAVTVNNKSFKSISDAARYFGIRPKLVHSRISKGWSVQSALTTPTCTTKK
ncbi:GIY-YIG nuclease family protein [Pseudoalteromonas sp. BDTF-M6]|uniref:GIY-YIG nuclease family protein n=1 Tax=Pseudoalteromonas sp. BDTF-M6 TaxID=2796132 RepID=UPI001BAF9A5D|nr:GIY-YIG nuclease family protein [Pseudoalteromonas sp. BDTF-M6]MBS3799094.1 GIY-YIG nuclease family protein [Pseudoalteromonas sp. BDTF-M6]